MRIPLAAALALLALLASCNRPPGQSAVQSPNPAAPASAEIAGVRQLFNGHDFDGWEHVGPGRFVVEGGLLRSEGGMGLLWYTGQKFGNCRVRVVYKTTSAASNSGVFVRISDRPADEWFAVHHGYEVQICDSQDEYHRTGAIYSLAKSATLASHPPGEWNVMEITLDGPRIHVTLNGAAVTDFDPAQAVPPRTKEFEPERGPRPEAGYLGIQNHDDYATGEHVYFKEISVTSNQ
jgi:3-keto-disaccharide hydrolase